MGSKFFNEAKKIRAARILSDADLIEDDDVSGLVHACIVADDETTRAMFEKSGKSSRNGLIFDIVSEELADVIAVYGKAWDHAKTTFSALTSKHQIRGIIDELEQAEHRAASATLADTYGARLRALRATLQG